MSIYDLAYFDVRISVGLWSVCCRFVIGLSSRLSAVGYESSIVLMIGFQSVSCRLSIGLKSGDSIPNLTRHDWFYGVFSNIVGGRQQADSVKILCFCRLRVGLAGVTGVLGTNVIEILIEVHTFPIMKLHLKISSISSRP